MKCPRCKKSNTYHAEADDTMFCHECGFVWGSSDYEDLKGFGKTMAEFHKIHNEAKGWN